MPWTAWSEGTASTTTMLTWQAWSQTTGASTNVLTQVWIDWTGSPGPVIASANGYREPTPEEREARRLAVEERQRAADAVRVKARELLVSVLDEEQRRELVRDGHFHVQTRDGERVYRIKPSCAPQRVKGEDGNRWSYCIHSRTTFPPDDEAAAFKLLLEADEDMFLRTANATLMGRVPA